MNDGYINPSPFLSHSPMAISIQDQSPSSLSRKRKRIQTLRSESSPWRTDRTRQIYSGKLLSSLRRLRLSPSARAVRAAADLSLAAAARGGFRWSRAVLSAGGISLVKPVRRARLNRPRKPFRRAVRPDRREAAGAERKARVLGSLVPGCRKLQLASLLDETADYIAALEMQVRAMSMIADVLSAA